MYWFLRTLNEFSKNDYEQCLELMENSRREDVLKRQHVASRNMSVFGEWVIKKELSQKLNIPIEKITLLRTEHSKPYPKDIPINFNISHSDDTLAVAFSEKQIGIDIEIIKPLKTDITKRLCTEKDLEFLAAANNEDEQLLRFYKIWTAKEAYFKMLGTGITNLKSISYNEINALHFFEKNCIITIVEK